MTNQVTRNKFQETNKLQVPRNKQATNSKSQKQEELGSSISNN